jgi:hypothetical protein
MSIADVGKERKTNGYFIVCRLWFWKHLVWKNPTEVENLEKNWEGDISCQIQNGGVNHFSLTFSSGSTSCT